MVDGANQRRGADCAIHGEQTRDVRLPDLRGGPLDPGMRAVQTQPGRLDTHIGWITANELFLDLSVDDPGAKPLFDQR